MKKILIPLITFCVGIACALIFLNKQKTSPNPASVVDSAASQPAPPAAPEKIVAPKPEAPPLISANAGEPVKVSAAVPAASEVKPDAAAEAIHMAIDALLAAKNGAQKHELFQQLIKSGQMDQAIAELKQRALDNPNDAGIPTTLGEAQLNKVRAIRDAGGDINEQGILAMQADQSFNAALKIDPQNWEANYVKASSMYYWPADPVRDADIVQRLSGLIDQQEKAASSSPEFVQPYLTLGNQYVKMNQPEKAQATWRLGLQKFPNNPTLLKKINGQ